jgi:hypothetical protein
MTEKNSPQHSPARAKVHEPIVLPLSFKKENKKSPMRGCICRNWGAIGRLGSGLEQGDCMARVPMLGRRLKGPGKPLSPAPSTEGLSQSKQDIWLLSISCGQSKVRRGLE